MYLLAIVIKSEVEIASEEGENPSSKTTHEQSIKLVGAVSLKKKFKQTKGIPKFNSMSISPWLLIIGYVFKFTITFVIIWCYNDSVSFYIYCYHLIYVSAVSNFWRGKNSTKKKKKLL